ncbi:hypothetical protein [Youngiibacter multivorans]|uniref:Uncharacterized protein n=1 Tax=Youngiibacter multivorans TaxID=937251 RepID=A0ABS4G6X6_9CLOT|nr:hypothetical protein [Youngiibacter multivorans]MBP1920313.1 hypothetical protein [Youngiibacter multivorans]
MSKAEGKVGPFFYIDENVISDSKIWTEADNYGDFKDWGSHNDFWKIICIIYKVNDEEEYSRVPRGRVTYNTKTRVFHIYLNPDINNERVLTLILEEYCLKGFQYKIDDTDLHYKIYTPSEFDELMNNSEEG